MARQSSTTGPTDLPAYLVRGDDPVLTGDAVRDLVSDLVGDEDPAFAVEDLSGDDYEVAAVVEAAQTPPFFGDRRVVVARAVGHHHPAVAEERRRLDRKSTRLNSSHRCISYAVFCLKKKKKQSKNTSTNK